MFNVIKHLLNAILLLMLPIGVFAQSSTTVPASIQRVSLKVDLFMSSTCGHCKKADVFFSDLENKNSWLIVKRYYIDKDTGALQLFYQQLRERNISNFSVPAMFFCGTYWTGFDDPSSSGKSLIRALDYCHQQVAQQGTLSPTTIDLIQKWGLASQYQIHSNDTTSPMILIPMLALSDAFGPCSLFGLMVFLAFLWLYPTHRSVQLSLGIVLVACFGIIHYLQQAEAAFYYHWFSKLGMATLVTGMLLLLTILRDVQTSRKGLVLKPNGLIYFVAILSVFAVQMWQQSCPFNIDLVFEQWLNQQVLSTTRQWIYQFYYLTVYLSPLLIIILFYGFWGDSKRVLAWQPCLQKTAYLMLIAIGVLLISYPVGLSNLMLSIVVFVLAIGIGKLLTRNKSKN